MDASKKPSGKFAAIKSAKILVVDDNAVNLKVIGVLLKFDSKAMVLRSFIKVTGGRQDCG